MIDLDKIEQVARDADLIYSQKEVEAAFDTLATEIQAKLRNENPIVIGVLNGGLIPTSELVTRLDFPLELDYLHATRYQNGTRGGELNWIARPSQPLRDRTVLIVDDILDEGHTLAAILQYCREQGARAVYSAVLVDKVHARRASNLQADFTGLKIEDRYVFGYGMDYHGYHRNLKAIYAVRDL